MRRMSVWNSLPSYVVEPNNVNVFKAAVRNFLGESLYSTSTLVVNMLAVFSLMLSFICILYKVPHTSLRSLLLLITGVPADAGSRCP